jgi:hypothetical protein
MQLAVEPRSFRICPVFRACGGCHRELTCIENRTQKRFGIVTEKSRVGDAPIRYCSRVNGGVP